MRRGAAFAIFGAGLAIGIAASAFVLRGIPRSGPAGAGDPPKPAVHHPAGPDTVTIDPAMMQDLGVRTVAVEPRVITAAIRTTGYVSYDENRLSKVNARIGGWIEKVRVAYVGQEVHRGEQLLGIYSPELMLTEEDYLRSRELADSNNGGDGAARRDGAALMSAAAERLKLWGIAPSELRKLERTGHVSDTVPIEATAGGVVTATNVVEGAHVKAGDDLYAIADLSRVWVFADIYERELSLAQVGQAAEVSSDALAGKRFDGRVDYIYPEVNAQTRTVKVRLQFGNPRSELRPGMYVKVTLLAPSETRVLAVPAEAVLNSGVRNLVIVARGGGHFEPREVEVGAQSSGYFAVLSGLRPGERVVTSAQFLIDSESNLNEALSAMAPPAPKTPAPAPPEIEK
ncbi:MAG: efflux RND transporter periplasmic adaptor subunit [Candidatus Binataceae bacterium]